MRLTGVLVFIAIFGALPAMSQSGGGVVDMVLDIYSDEITVFQSVDGGGTLAEVERKDIVLPAPQLSRVSDNGLIMVRLEYRQSGKPPVIGWINAALAETGKLPKVDVVSDCARNLDEKVSSTRGTRALGDKC